MVVVVLGCELVGDRALVPTVGTTLEPELVVYACPGRVCPCELSPPPEPMSSTYGSMSFGPPLWREEPALDMVENGGREEGAEWIGGCWGRSGWERES